MLMQPRHPLKAGEVVSMSLHYGDGSTLAVSAIVRRGGAGGMHEHQSHDKSSAQVDRRLRVCHIESGCPAWARRPERCTRSHPKMDAQTRCRGGESLTDLRPGGQSGPTSALNPEEEEHA